MSGTAPIGTLPIATAPAVEIAAAAQENVLLLSPIDSDAATISASSEATALPASNLQDYQPKKVWRSSGTSESLTLTFATPVDADTLALVGHNLSDAGVIRVVGAASIDGLDIDTVTPPADSGWQSAWPATGKPTIANWPQWLSVVRWPAVGAYLYWRVYIADPAATQTYLQAGRLMLGAAWQAQQNLDIDGTPLAFDQADIQIVGDYGDIFTDRRSKSAPRIFQMKVSAGDQDDVLNGIAEIQRLRGMWGDVVCLLDPGETTHFHRQSMQGVFRSPQSHAVVPAFQNGHQCWTWTLNLREVV